MPISIRFEPIWHATVGKRHYYFSNFAALRMSICRSWSQQIPIIASQPTSASVLITDQSGRVLLEANEIKLHNEPIDLVA